MRVNSISRGDATVWRVGSVDVARVIGSISNLESRSGEWRGRFWYFEGRIFKRNSAQSPSDTEIISCLLYSPLDFCELFWGTYRIVVLDVERGELCALSDPCGQSPIYLHVDRGGTWHLCSEMDDFVTSGNISLTVNFEYLHRYLCFEKIDPKATGWQEIECLPAGHLLKIKKHGGSSAVPMWRPEFVKPREQALDPIDTLQFVVEALLHGREKIYLELSGGVESTAIAVALARSGMGEKVIAVTYNDPSMTASDEAEIAGTVANKLKIRHQVYSLNEILPFSPFSKPPLVSRPSLLLAQLSQLHNQAYVGQIDGDTSVVNGHGGDALFLAPPPLGAPIEALMRLRLGRAMTSAFDLAIYYRTSLISILAHNLRVLCNGSMSCSTVNTENRAIRPLSTLNHAFRDTSMLASKLRLRPARLQQIHQFIATLDETLVSLFPLKGRSIFPFLSQPIVELALSINPEELFSGYFDRKLVRNSIYRVSDLGTVWRMGKGDTTRNSLNGVYKHRDHIRDVCLNGRLVAAGIVNRAVMEHQINRALRGCHDPLKEITSVFCAEVFIEGGVR